jgi:hypothetical protein
MGAPNNGCTRLAGLVILAVNEDGIKILFV